MGKIIYSIHWAQRFLASFAASSIHVECSQPSRQWQHVSAHGNGNWRREEAWPDYVIQSTVNLDQQTDIPPHDHLTLSWPLDCDPEYLVKQKLILFNYDVSFLSHAQINHHSNINYQNAIFQWACRWPVKHPRGIILHFCLLKVKVSGLIVSYASLDTSTVVWTITSWTPTGWPVFQNVMVNQTSNLQWRKKNTIKLIPQKRSK